MHARDAYKIFAFQQLKTRAALMKSVKQEEGKDSFKQHPHPLLILLIDVNVSDVRQV
jgi:hypothetical protein